MRFLFEDYTLDLERRELKRGQQAVPMTPQAFDLLVVLIQNRNLVISRDRLLESVWGGRIVSESTINSHINAVRQALGDNGQEQRLIRTVSRKGVHFVGLVSELDTRPMPAIFHGSGNTLAGIPPVPARPSIAVLPFANLSENPLQGYFADGITEDIIGALTRVHRLFVAARSSSFSYRGRAINVQQIGRELGVRYVLDGSLRRAADRVRVSAHLIDAVTGRNIWADRFDSVVDDIIDVQNYIAISVVGAMMPKLEQAEINRAMYAPTESMDAYEHYLRGMACFNRGGRRGLRQALTFFYRAIELDPEFGMAYCTAAWCYVLLKQSFWMDDIALESAEGARLARLAVEVENEDGRALTWGTYALGHFGEDLDICSTHMTRALNISPHLSKPWYLSGGQKLSAGRHEEALERISQAQLIDPGKTEVREIAILSSLAHMLQGRVEEAGSWAQKAFEVAPDLPRAIGLLAASHALCGRGQEAARAMKFLRQHGPELRLSGVRNWVHLRRQEDLDVFEDGLRRAGLPE